MEDIAPYPLPNSHAQVDEETDTSDSDSGIFLICRCKICIVMLVRVSVGVTSSQGHGCAYSNERQASWALTTTDEWGIRADCSQCRMRAADLRRCVKVLCDPKYSRNVSSGPRNIAQPKRQPHAAGGQEATCSFSLFLLCSTHIVKHSASCRSPPETTRKGFEALHSSNPINSPRHAISSHDSVRLGRR